MDSICNFVQQSVQFMPHPPPHTHTHTHTQSHDDNIYRAVRK